MEETKAALTELNMYSTDNDVYFLFNYLDPDRDGVLDVGNSDVLAKDAEICNNVIDFIPLSEIDGIEVAIELKDHSRTDKKSETIPASRSEVDPSVTSDVVHE